MNKLLLVSLTLAGMLGAQPARDRHVIVVSLDGFPAYMLHDPNVPLPVLRKLMAQGGAAEGMISVNPTVTWPNHTAMVSGVNSAKHGVIYNGMPVRPGEGTPLKVEPWIDKNELVQARTVYDAAHDAGLTVAEVDWVAIYHAAAVNWSFPELPKEDSAMEKELVSAGVITADELRAWTKAPITFKDELWTRAAVHIIEKHKPNLMLMHLLTTDSVQHQLGARTLAAETALILADRQLQRVLDAVDRAGIRDRTTLLVVSDHGFKTYQHLIHANALLREKGLLREQNGQIEGDAWVVAEGGTAMVYATRESRRAETLKTLEEAFRGVPGVASIIHPAEYAKYGYPEVKPQGRMADFVVAAAPGYAFDGSAKGDVVTDVPAGATVATHGYLNSEPDMTAIFVAYGRGIKPGSRVGTIPNLRVAPTIARLLGLNFTPGEGALEELLAR